LSAVLTLIAAPHGALAQALIETLEALGQQGIGLRSLTEAIDTTP
jgi:hypothetical protein